MPLETRRDSGPRTGEIRGPQLAAARTVLVVARNHEKAGAIVGALQERGLPALHASTETQASFWIREQPPALVLLDLSAEGSRPLLEELRGLRRTVVALSDDSDVRMNALEKGCIEASPLALPAREIALHAAALVRARRPIRYSTVDAYPLRVDLANKRLTWRGVEMNASPLLLRLAAYLAAHAGELVPTKVLCEEVWEQSWDEPNKVHQGIWRLRRLLGEGRGSSVIVGRRGHGYGLFVERATGVRVRAS